VTDDKGSDTQEARAISTAYLFKATFKKLMIESAMYSLSSGPIPLWLPKKNDCRMII